MEIETLKTLGKPNVRLKEYVIESVQYEQEYTYWEDKKIVSKTMNKYRYQFILCWRYRAKGKVKSKDILICSTESDFSKKYGKTLDGENKLIELVEKGFEKKLGVDIDTMDDEVRQWYENVREKAIVWFWGSIDKRNEYIRKKELEEEQRRIRQEKHRKLMEELPSHHILRALSEFNDK